MMNSIQIEMDGASIASEILLQSAVHEGSFLLVEGHTDARLLEKFSSDVHCVVVVSFSKTNVFAAIMILDKNGFSRALGLVDVDCDPLFGAISTSRNIVYTDGNDVEMMILCSPALELVLKEYGSDSKIAALGESGHAGARELVISAGAELGALRVVSRNSNLNLRFSGMKFRFANNTSIDIDVEKQYEHVLQRSELSTAMSVDEVRVRAAEYLSKTTEKKELCCGRDCVRILGRGIRSRLGSDSRFDSSKRIGELSKVLRLAYEKRFFEETTTYSDMQAWEMRSGCKIFAC